MDRRVLLRDSLLHYRFHDEIFPSSPPPFFSLRVYVILFGGERGCKGRRWIWRDRKCIVLRFMMWKTQKINFKKVKKKSLTILSIWDNVVYHRYLIHCQVENKMMQMLWETVTLSDKYVPPPCVKAQQQQNGQMQWLCYTLKNYTITHSKILALPGNTSRRQDPIRHLL